MKEKILGQLTIFLMTIKVSFRSITGNLHSGVIQAFNAIVLPHRIKLTCQFKDTGNAVKKNKNKKTRKQFNAVFVF